MESRDNFLQCSVCSTEFDDNCRTPRILPCLHTFCSSCIQDLATKLEVECPDCDAKHGRPQNGISDYPIDIACRNFLDFIRVQQRPSEVPCTDCPDRDVAQTFCKDCSTFMCKECTNAHKRTQLTRKHLVVALTELKESGLDEFHRKETCNVRGHEDQSFTFYCDKRGCDKPVCTLCAVSEHNQTNGHVLRNLADVYEDGKAVIQNVITELNDKGSPIPEAMEKYQYFLQDLSMKENDVNKEIDRTFDKLQQILHERREQLHKDVQSQSQSRCKVLQDRIKELQSFNGDVVNATNFTSRVISYTNPTEFLQMKNHILKRLVELKSLSVSIPEKSDLGMKFAVGISEESFAQLVRGIGNISQSVNARKDLHLQINERDASYRHAYPVSNGVRESFESPRSDVSSSSRQVQQNISSPITNGPTTPVKYTEDRSMLSPRMVRLTSPKTVQDKPVVAPKTNS
ncbi:hypothetical protein KUTeg_011627 [Tegillarca granosa]|uniref:Uncharacterized protein n=1 Tax=Tegillarca granosa TaxID=220873 RepID=A0ABQ9F1L8_TEGGR|nr:hypothetical protein KUTeg_011627 [Tegillarca granosa]